MKKKVRQILKICLLFIVLIIPFTYLSYVRADSGWDTGYSGGSSGGSSGGWSSGGSSSWSTGGSSRSRDSYSDGEAGSEFVAFLFIIFIVIVVLAIMSEKNGNVDDSNQIVESQTYPDITETLIKQYLPDYDLGSLKNMAYQKFLQIQTAWMNFDYDALRELCTDELYNTYKSQLKVLETKKQKNVMTNFNLLENRVIDIMESSERITVEFYMRISFFDYVINVETNNAVMGTKNSPITNNYKMNYVIAKDRQPKNKCPNCGAPFNAVTSKECEYCGSTIVFDSKDFVLSKKTNEKTTR